MDEQTTIYLIRHGESEFNKLERITGHLDPSLTEFGKQQALKTKAKLKHVNFDAVYSSDLQRAVLTGEIIYGAAVPQANRHKGLRERDFGSLDGKPNSHWDAVTEKKKAMPEPQRWHYKHVPDMESDHELAERFVAALEEVVRKNQRKTLLVVAHGGSIRATVMRLGNLSNDELPPGSITNAGYAKLVYKNGKFEVIEINP